MTKTFILGLILGLLGTAAIVYWTPAVDLHREASLISVQPNVGNREAFHINLPHDRIVAGSRSGEQTSTFPAGVKWPQEEKLDGSSSEVFKLRNSNDTVVGIAARISSTVDTSGPFVQWMLHLPARGSMFAEMQLALTDEDHREGLLARGTREFAGMTGSVQEKFNTDAGEDVSGKLELVVSLRATDGDGE